MTQDIESDRNVALFKTTSLVALSVLTRLDAVGFGTNTGATCDLLRESSTLTPLAGSTLQYSYFRDECGKKGNPALFGPCPSANLPADTNVNNNDFIFADTAGTNTPAGLRLGAPGPENLGSPRLINQFVPASLLDATKAQTAAPNRVRDLAAVGPNAALGTMSIRRRFTNTTSQPITRLRFRIVDISTFQTSPPIADVRALDSLQITVTGITDSATCAAAGQVIPCSVQVFGTTLEQPPAQALGGGWNSSLSAGVITVPTPLAPGQSINFQFLLGVQASGSFKFFFNIEALP
jgi:hypothetical protein